MQNSPRGSSSDLERARSLALRLSQDPTSPDRTPTPPPAGYVRFSSSRFRGAVDEEVPPTAPPEARAPEQEPVVTRPEPRIAPPEPPPMRTAARPLFSAPRPEPVPARMESEPEPSPPPATAQPEPPAPPAARATAPARAPSPPPPPPPPLRSAAPPRPAPPPSPAEAEPEEPPAIFIEASPAEEEAGAETELEMEEVGETEAPEEAAPEAAILPELTPEPSEFEEDLEPLPWSQILDDCVYLAHGRGAFVMNAGGQIVEVTGPWPKPKLEPIGARLMKLMDEATAAQGKGGPSPVPTLQLGTFCLTGLRVLIAGQDVTVGLIAEAALSPEVRPAIEGELRRGKPV